MVRMKLKDYKEKVLKDPEFKKEYENLLRFEIPKPLTININDGTREVKVNLEKLIDFLMKNKLTED
jgi:hypothetical protein